MAIVTTPLGFQKPDGTEPVKEGDNVISYNAQKADDTITADRARLDKAEAKLNRGTLPDLTDLNAFYEAVDVGAWALPSTNTYPNAPAFSGTAIFELVRSSTAGVIQRITSGAVMLWREASNAATGSWSAWEQVETKADSAANLTTAKAYTDTETAKDRVRLTAVEAKNAAHDASLSDLPNQYVPLSRGIIASGTDLNTMTGTAHVGAWSMLTTSTYPNAPAVTLTSTAVLEIQRGGVNSVTQMLTFGGVTLRRESIDSNAGTWSAWEQTETLSHATATFETKTASAQNLTDAKAYTDTEVGADRGRLTAVETKNTAQDGRIGAVEAKQAVKAVRLEAGLWVWDLPGATHYLFPETGGGLSVHATAWPVPNPNKPELDW